MLQPLKLSDSFVANSRHLFVIGDKLNIGNDFFIAFNTNTLSCDYLVFLDSRGIGRQYESSIASKIIEKLGQRKKTYIIICRPLELTTWATLISFLRVNKIKPLNIITNMGFVDFTPKKKVILENSIYQVDKAVGIGVAKPVYVQHYASLSGPLIPLYALEYDNRYRKSVENIANSTQLLILNTPLTDSNIKIQRKRPSSFYLAQKESNCFNQSIRGARVINFPDFNEMQTYDAVHYTCSGNELIYQCLEPYL